MKRRVFLTAVAVATTGCLYDAGNGEDADAPSAEIEVEASTDELTLPTDGFELTVTNNGDEEYRGRIVGMAKVVDGEQRHIRPLAKHREDIARVTAEPGESWSTHVSIDNTEPGDGPFVIPDSTDSFTGLGPGTYLVGPGRVDQDGADEERMAFELEAAAELEVVGDAPELEAVGEYEVERDGEVVTIEHEEYAEEYGGTVVFRRLGEDEVEDEVPSLIHEQILQLSSYRDAVSFFDEDVSEVRRKPAVSPGYYGTEDRFEFDGDVYEVVENPSDSTEEEWRGGVVLAVRLNDVPEGVEVINLDEISGAELRDTVLAAIEDSRGEEEEMREELGREPEEDERPHGSSSLSQKAAEELDRLPSREGRFYNDERYIRYEEEVYAVGVREHL